MAADVTAMASANFLTFLTKRCATCNTLGCWTPRMWECDVCLDHFLCENCYKEAREDSEVVSAPPQVHNQDHSMSPHLTAFRCDGCKSIPIWNQRWRCKACSDFDLCEACYGDLDAVDMPLEHSKEHPMIAVEVLRAEKHKFPSSFSKPVDPQWSYWVFKRRSDTGVQNDFRSGFRWVKKTPLAEIFSTNHMSAVLDDNINQTSLNANEDNSGHILKLEKQSSLNFKGLSIKQAAEVTPTQRKKFDEKHKIFLSHAEAEKDFVEQLYLDLSRVHHFGIFFDKEDESLPKGEPFPQKIFDAAKHCQLAIVVISTDYFTRKWPMLELATFVEAQKTRPELKLLPVFYKLSAKEFKEPGRQQSYVKFWNQLPRSSVAEGDTQQWKEALKVISRTNGIEYDKLLGEVAFREKIVETVYKRVKPDLLWDDSHVQGKGRMHKMIQEIRISNSASTEAPSTCTLCIGLYGMGGSGKTTMCKVFCNQMMQHYLGKVCHIEFGNMDLVQLCKKLLQSINLIDSNLLLTIEEGQALNLLKHHMPKHKICLVIDNVSDSQASIEEARAFLSLPFKEGSLILVTSRSFIILEKLKIKKRALMRIPALSTNEARALFSYHAGCDISTLPKNQKKAMENFVEQCHFNVEDMVSREYHPLALKVLGTRVGANLEDWQNIKIDFKYYENENKNHIFSILRSSYDALIPQYQRMFLDIALSRSSLYGAEWQMRCLYGENDKRFISDLVKDLQAKSLVEFYDTDSGDVYIHDLYFEFAKMEVEKKGLQHSPSCCLSRTSKPQHSVQARRLRIENQLVPLITKDLLSCTICSEAELLIIQGCPNLKSVDVRGMQHLKIIQLYGGCPQLTSVNLEGVVSLRCLYWDGFLGEYPDLTSLESLEGLWLVNDEVISPPPLQGSLDFSRSSNLDTLQLSYLPLGLLNLNQAVNLRFLRVSDCRYFEKFDGLEALVKLEELLLYVCSSLLEFPSLVNFPSLKHFQLEGAANLKEIHGFANSTALLKLSLKGGKELEELPGIEACTRLNWLDLSGTNLGVYSWISAMKDLTIIDLSRTKIRLVPKCSELSKLSELFLDDCEALEILGNEMGIHLALPRNLLWISAKYTRSLKVLPQFNHESDLQYLNISGTSVEEISGVMNCKHLEELHCAETRVTNLPDLSSLTSLKVLDVHGCKLLTRMDSIKTLPALEKLFVFDCSSLLALPELGSSKGLTTLSLIGCPSINPNLVKLPTESSVDLMEMAENAAEEQSDSDVERVEGENQTLALMDSEEPEPSHSLGRSATLFNWVALSSVLVWWFGRKLGKRRLAFENAVERR